MAKTKIEKPIYEKKKKKTSSYNINFPNEFNPETAPTSIYQDDFSKKISGNKSSDKKVTGINPSIPEYYKDKDTGEVMGVTLPDGRTFLGKNKDINRILELDQKRRAIPQGTQPAGTAQAQANQAMQQGQFNLDAQSGMLPSQQMPINEQQIIPDEGIVSKLATGAAAGAGAIYGAKAGAAIGTLIAPGLGTSLGIVIGGIGGAIGGAYAKVSIQERQDIKQAYNVFGKAKTNKAEIINMINAGLINEGKARELWQEEKTNIYSAHTYLKRQTDNDLNDFLGNPGDELVAVESYLNLDAAYDIEFEKALLQPNPANIINLIPQEDEQIYSEYN